MELVKDGKIEFRLNSWMENAAIVGLINILGDKVILHDQSIEVPIKEFENFEEAYFGYFAKQYQKLSSLSKVLSYEEEMNRNKQDKFAKFDQSDYERLQKYLVDLKRYGESNSYLAVYPLIDSDVDIINLIKQVKTEKLKKGEFDQNREQVIERVRNAYQVLTEIFSYYKREDVQRYLAAKIQIYSVINNGYNDVSFLNRQESKGDFFVKYHDYFVESMLSYLEDDHEKDKLSCTNCGHPIKKGDISFSFINQAGYDANRKQSNAWAFTNDLFMCPACRLLYTCISAGFTYVYNQGIFVNDNHSVESLVKVNSGIRLNVLDLNKDEVKTNNIYAALIRTLQNEMSRQSRRELQDIQVVRYGNERYYFNLLPRHILRTIDSSKEKLSKLYNARYSLNNEPRNIYPEIVDKLMNNNNLFLLIYQVLRAKNSDGQVYCNAAQIMKMIEINLIFLKELKEMKKEQELKEEDLEKIRKAGYRLKLDYYKSANENKVKTISWKLLEALRAGNKDTFMNVLLNSYSYFNNPVPKVFLKPHLSDEMFQTIGQSFLTGMIGEPYKTEGGKVNE